MNYDYLDDADFKNEHLISSSPQVMDFYLENVKCAACLSKVENISNELDGINRVDLNLGNHVAQVELSSSGKFSEVASLWHKRGFTPHPIAKRANIVQERRKENRTLLNRIAVAGVLTGNIMLFSFAVYSGADSFWSQHFDQICAVLFLGILFYSSVPFFKNAFSSLRAKRASIDLPIALSIAVGAAISYINVWRTNEHVYFDSLATLVFLILSSRYILNKFQQDLLAPEYFKDFFKIKYVLRKKSDSSYEKIAADKINVGDSLLINDGDVVPVDAVLKSSDTWLDSSILNGEFMPEKFQHGQKICAGAKCLSEGTLIQSTSTIRNSYLGRLIDEVENQLLRKTPLISLTDKIAQYFTLSVLAIGTVFFLLYMSVDLGEAINRSLALVILACPCALAFATPLSQSLSLSILAKNGILVKRAEVLEKVQQISSVIFDKTGTLSQGKLQFIEWIGKEPSLQEKAIIFALEQRSKHPIGRSLKDYLKNYQDSSVETKDWKEVVGEGVFAEVNSQNYSVQSYRDPNLKFKKSCVALYRGGDCLAIAHLGDVRHEDSRATLQKIHQLKKEIFIISGDSHSAVEEFSRPLELAKNNIFAQLSPKEKEIFVKQKEKSIMVGDGANDLLALSGSHVSVAVKGSIEASLGVADVYMIKDGVRGVFELIEVSKESLSVVKRNLTISLIYNVLGATAALLGWINPLIAAILMPLSSCLVVASAFYGTAKLREYSKRNKTKLQNTEIVLKESMA